MFLPIVQLSLCVCVCNRGSFQEEGSRCEIALKANLISALREYIELPSVVQIQYTLDISMVQLLLVLNTSIRYFF